MAQKKLKKEKLPYNLSNCISNSKNDSSICALTGDRGNSVLSNCVFIDQEQSGPSNLL